MSLHNAVNILINSDRPISVLSDNEISCKSGNRREQLQFLWSARLLVHPHFHCTLCGVVSYA